MQLHMKEQDTIIVDQLVMSSSAAKNVQADHYLQRIDNAGHTIHASHVQINVGNVQNVTDVPGKSPPPHPSQHTLISCGTNKIWVDV